MEARLRISTNTERKEKNADLAKGLWERQLESQLQAHRNSSSGWQEQGQAALPTGFKAEAKLLTQQRPSGSVQNSSLPFVILTTAIKGLWTCRATGCTTSKMENGQELKRRSTAVSSFQSWANPEDSRLSSTRFQHLKRSRPARPLVAASSGKSSSGGFPLWDEYAFKESTSSARLPVTPSSMKPRDQQMKPGAPFSAGCKKKNTGERKKCCFVLPSRPTFSSVNGKQNFCLLAKMPLGAEGTTYVLTMLAAQNTPLPGFSGGCGPSSLAIWLLIPNSDHIPTIWAMISSLPWVSATFPTVSLRIPNTTSKSWLSPVKYPPYGHSGYIAPLNSWAHLAPMSSETPHPGNVLSTGKVTQLSARHSSLSTASCLPLVLPTATNSTQHCKETSQPMLLVTERYRCPKRLWMPYPWRHSRPCWMELGSPT